MTMNNEIVIREFSRKLVFWGCIYLFCVWYVVSELLSLMGIIDITFNDQPLDFAVYVFFILGGPITYWFLRDDGNYLITDSTISVYYPFRRRRCIVYLNRPVYYSIYDQAGEHVTCIIVSNYEFVSDYVNNAELDYGSQIELPYRKKVRNALPKDGWINIPYEKGK